MEKEELKAVLSIEEKGTSESVECKDASNLSSVLQKEVGEKVDNLALDELRGLVFVTWQLHLIQCSCQFT